MQMSGRQICGERHNNGETKSQKFAKVRNFTIGFANS